MSTTKVDSPAASPFPLPQPTPLTQPFWDGLQAGRLRFMRCLACDNAWLPARSECPRCLAPRPAWQDAAGGGSIVSWVVYHHCYHEAFRGRLPYNVATIELDEGPRLLANVVGVRGAEGLSMGGRVRLKIEQEDGFALARFELDH